jgi:hypothetical protein
LSNAATRSHEAASLPYPREQQMRTSTRRPHYTFLSPKRSTLCLLRLGDRRSAQSKLALENSTQHQRRCSCADASIVRANAKEPSGAVDATSPLALGRKTSPGVTGDVHRADTRSVRWGWPSAPLCSACDPNSSIINPIKGGFVESTLLDVAGHRRSPATMPGSRRPPTPSAHRPSLAGRAPNQRSPRSPGERS